MSCAVEARKLLAVSFAQVLILHLKSLQNWQAKNPPNTVLIRKRIFDAVSNFGIGDASGVKGLDEIVADLFEDEGESVEASLKSSNAIGQSR